MFKIANNYRVEMLPPDILLWEIEEIEGDVIFAQIAVIANEETIQFLLKKLNKTR
jgi:hypothetical protein